MQFSVMLVIVYFCEDHFLQYTLMLVVNINHRFLKLVALVVACRCNTS